MKNRAEIILLKLAYVILLFTLFFIPSFFTDDQSIISNTINDLGTYSLYCSLIVNIIFLLLAAGSLISGWKYYYGLIFQRIILVLFSLFLIFAALTDLASSIVNIRHIQNLSQLHFYFITNVWLTFIILTFSTYTILKTQTEKNITITTGIMVALLLVLISESNYTAGIWERILIIISFGWMIHTYGTNDNKRLKINY
jgi:hypothetical protein